MSDLSKFKSKEYRDGFLQTTVRGWIAYQAQALREKLELTQAQFADLIGTTQSVVSRMENDRGAPNVQTLLDMACKLDVALVVQFVSYPEFLKQTEDMSAARLTPETIDESLSEKTFAGYSVLDSFWRSKDASADQGIPKRPSRPRRMSKSWKRSIAFSNSFPTASPPPS